MFGKFPRCFIITISLFCLTASLWAAKNQLPEKDKFTVNGYWMLELDSKKVRGLRLKAQGDMLLRKGAYALAIQPYEDASKYLPNEADIYFGLGYIYAHEKIYKLAAQYYRIAAGKYQLPENHAKTQKYYYISLLQEGMAWIELNKWGEAAKVAAVLRSSEKDYLANFPELADEIYEYLTKFPMESQ